jgi:hypothetical protein
MPKTMTTTNIDDLLADSGVVAEPASGASIAAEATAVEAKPEGTYLGTFRADDGRWLHKYADSNSRSGYMILPKKVEDMSEEDFYAMPISLLDGQAGRIPQTLTVKFKDPQWAGRWFNRLAQNGRRVSEARALGYEPAHADDCEWLAHGTNDGDGAVIDNDLVLMKIHKAKLFLQYKEWMDLARVKGGQTSYKQEAENMVGGRGGDKVSHYLTPQATGEFHGLGPVQHLATVS